MNMRVCCGLCCWLAAGMLFVSSARADDLYSKPITSASADSKEGDRWWGPGGALIPETEWRPYVGRKPAFGGSGTFNSWGAEPARMPQIGSNRSGGAAKRNTSASSAAAKPKPADPCEEKIRQALEEAARTGKIPASAMPSPSAASPGSVPAVQAQAGASTAPGQGQVVTGSVQAAPPPVVSVPGISAPNVPPSGAAVQSINPNQVTTGAGTVRNP